MSGWQDRGGGGSGAAAAASAGWQDRGDGAAAEAEASSLWKDYTAPAASSSGDKSEAKTEVAAKTWWTGSNGGSTSTREAAARNGHDRSGKPAPAKPAWEQKDQADPWVELDPWGSCVKKAESNSWQAAAQATTSSSKASDSNGGWQATSSGADTGADARWQESPAAPAANGWQEPSAAPAANGWQVPSAAPATNAWQEPSAAAAADRVWQQSASSAAPAAAWQDSAAPKEQADDQQRRDRQRDFKSYQDWYIQEGILPGKTDEEKAADMQRLFGEDSAKFGEGVDFDLYDQVHTEVSGPKAEQIPLVKTFEELYETFNGYIPEALMDNIRRCGYTRPTPVQKYAIPAALAGRDIMCCAQTGSGKTAAFLVPILGGMIMNHRATGGLKEPFTGMCKPDTLILSPTRELCLQIYDEALKFCHDLPYRIVRVYGQEPVRTQLQEIAKGADVIVATPGRLWDFVSSGVIELQDVNTLVLDEADRMLSMQMEGFLRDIMEKYGMPAKTERHTMMFSATFPEATQALAKDFLHEYLWVSVGSVGGAVHTVTQTLTRVAPEGKCAQLIETLDEFMHRRESDPTRKGERLMVFTNSKLQSKGLDEHLHDKNFDTGALHGDLTQLEREENLRKFRAGDIDIMVCTDVASRGLDISGVSHVVNYDLPWDIDVYVQRIGRTGRIGHRGYATTFIAVGADGTWTDKPEVLQALVPILTGAQQEVPAWLHDQVEATKSQVYDSSARGQWGTGEGRSDARSQESWSQEKSQKQASASQDKKWTDWTQGNAEASSSFQVEPATVAADPAGATNPMTAAAEGIADGRSAAWDPQEDKRWPDWTQGNAVASSSFQEEPATVAAESAGVTNPVTGAAEDVADARSAAWDPQEETAAAWLVGGTDGDAVVGAGATAPVDSHHQQQQWDCG